MPWEFNNIVKLARTFADDVSGMELAFVFSEWTPEGGMGLMEAYLVERENQPPIEPLVPYLAKRIWVQINNGPYEPLVDVPQVTAIGLGDGDKVISGVSREVYLAGWKAKGIGAGYIVAPSTTMDQINTDRTVGVALIRVRVNEDDGDNPFDPSKPLTDAQITALNNWLGDHDVTPDEFAGLFGKSVAEMVADLKIEPRWKLAELIHTKFA